MFREILKSKIHRATVTVSNVDYEGSIEIDRSLMDAVDIAPYEKVLVANMKSGNRFETYVIEGEADSGVIGVNGAAAHLAAVRDEVIIMSFAYVEKKDILTQKPKIVKVDAENRII